MRKILSILFVSIITALPAFAVTGQTSLVANNIDASIGGTPLASGQLCFTPVDSTGRITGFEENGVQYLPTPMCYPVTNGSIGASVTVPDTSLSAPSIGYKIAVQSSTGVLLYNWPQTVYPFGSSWSLDTWFPTQTANITTPTINFSAYAPQGRCGTAPALDYTPTQTYSCQNQIWVPISGTFTGGTLTQPLTLPGNPTTALQAATKQYVDAATALAIPLAGGTMTGQLTLSGNPNTALAAATKSYVDSATNLLLPLSGGPMTGALILPSDPTTALGAATKQYVDAHTTNLTPNAIQFATDAQHTRAVRYTDNVALYHSQAKVTGNRINTTFDDGAAGSAVVGTSPATVVPAGTQWTSSGGDNGWQYKSGGGINHPSATGSSGSGIVIDTGVSDYTMNLTMSGWNNNDVILIRYKGTNNYLYFAYTNGTFIALVDVENGVGTTLWQQDAGGNSGTWQIVTSGRTIKLTNGSKNPTITLPVNSNNITGTQIGFAVNPNQTDPVVISSLQVIGTITTQPVCAGILQSDGLCSSPGTSTFAVSDNTGHIQPLPEKQTKTDALGNVTIACDEDYGMGRFDPRCSKYGNGGILGSNPAQAMQDLSTALICYEGQTGTMPTVNFPAGSFPIGTATNPTLQLPIGHYVGAGGRNGNGTNFRATYNNVTALTFNFGLTATCSDGISRSGNVQGGSVQGISETGCYAAGCINKPGDNGSWPNGGPGQRGIFIGDAKGIYRDIAVSNNGSDGLQLDGQDSVLDGAFAVGDNRFFLDSLPFNTSMYTFGAGEKHGSILCYGVDNQCYNIETYGSYLPGSGCTRGSTSGPTGCNIGAEYGHIYAAMQGDQSNLNGFFLQVAEMGLWLDGTHTKTLDGRIENMYGQGVTGAGNGVITGVNVVASCMDATAKTKSINNHWDPACYYFDVAGYETSAIHAFSGNGYFGQDYPTKDAFAGNLIGFSGSIAESDSRLPGGWGINKEKRMTGNYGGNVTGPSPSVAGANGITPADTTPTNYTGFTTKWDGQDLWITGGNANVTLLGPGSGGHFYNCNGGNLNLAQVAMHHYVIHYTDGVSYGNYLIIEECAIPSMSNVNTGVLAVNNGGTGTASPAITSGAGISVSGSFPNQQVSNSGVTSMNTLTGDVSIAGGAGTSISSSGSTVTVSVPGVITTQGTWTSFNSTNFSGTNTYGIGSAFDPPGSAAIQNTTMLLATAPVGCTTYPVVALYDISSGTGVELDAQFEMTLASGQRLYTYTPASPFSVGDPAVLAWGIKTAAVGCTTAPLAPSWSVSYTTTSTGTTTTPTGGTTAVVTVTNSTDTTQYEKAVCYKPNCDPGGTDAPASAPPATISTLTSPPTADTLATNTSLTTNATSTQTNALWTEHFTTCDTCTNFSDDFWMRPSASAISYASSLESDVYNFSVTDDVMTMGGLQCNLGTHRWQIDNQDSGWIDALQNNVAGQYIACNPSAGVDYHVGFKIHRVRGDTACQVLKGPSYGSTTVPGPCVYYDSLTINGTTYTLNQKMRATLFHEFHPTWVSAEGTQKQTDIGATTGTAYTVTMQYSADTFVASK